MKRVLHATLMLAAVACALLAAYAINGLRGGMGSPPAEMFAYQRQTESTGVLPQLWQVPSFAFKDQHGKDTTERDLTGTVWIADFIYTSCTNVCPMISAKRALLERKLAGAPLRFVSFSVDPEHDTPAALSAYAATWGGDERWLLFTATCSCSSIRRAASVESTTAPIAPRSNG
jgi:cytochrome oxidase Cu insertion factor (SCO1/SenC/PrrC family)